MFPGGVRVWVEPWCAALTAKNQAPVTEEEAHVWSAVLLKAGIVYLLP